MNKDSAPFDLDNVAEIVANAALRKALGLPYTFDRLPQLARDVAGEIVEEISSNLIILDDNSIIRCRLCGRGPFTRKGFYLHVKRTHMGLLKSIAKEKIELMLWHRMIENRL